MAPAKSLLRKRYILTAKKKGPRSRQLWSDTGKPHAANYLATKKVLSQAQKNVKLESSNLLKVEPYF